MTFIKKHLSDLIVMLGLSIAYFATRLYNLMSLPMFTDEAIYTRWSQIAKQDASWRFISLTDGKQPSFVWLDMISMKFFSDPLLAGRMVSVAAGAFSLVGIYFLASELFKNKKIGLIASAIYLIYPFALVYDRMALYDSLVTAIGIWALYLEVLLVRRLRLDIALILGMVLGFGLLTKQNAFLFIYLMPFTLLLFDWKGKLVRKRLLKWIGLAFISTVLAFGFYMILRLSPFFHIIAEKTALFSAPFSEWIRDPLRDFYGNFRGLLSWFISYFTFPAAIFALISIYWGKKYLKENLLLFLWFFIPLLGLAATGRILYPRFILTMTIFLLPILAFGVYYVLTNYKNKFLKYGIIIAAFALMFRSDFYVLVDFPRAPIAKPDTDQFANSWPAGGGVREIVTFFEEKARNQKIYVATEGTFGSLPTYTIEIYLGENRNIDKRGIYPLPSEIPQDLLTRAATMPVYLVINDSKNPPPNWPVNLINRFQKGIGDYYMSLYEVIPNN